MARGGLGRDFYSILDDNMIEEKKDSKSDRSHVVL